MQSEGQQAPRDCFETTDWDLLCDPHEENINQITYFITNNIYCCGESTIPTRTVQQALELKALLNGKKRIFRSVGQQGVEEDSLGTEGATEAV